MMIYQEKIYQDSSHPLKISEDKNEFLLAGVC
jgi:hypothetical protein